MNTQLTSLSECLRRVSTVDKKDVFRTSITVTFANGKSFKVKGRDFEQIQLSAITAFIYSEETSGYITVELSDENNESLCRVSSFLILDMLMISGKNITDLVCHNYFKIFQNPVILASLELNDPATEEPDDMLNPLTRTLSFDYDLYNPR